MSLRTKLILIIVLLFNVSLLAQNSYILTGKVSDKENDPLIGVSVSTASTLSKTLTDVAGNYELSVNNGDVLLFSYTGYATQSISITDQKTLNITLEKDAILLDEIAIGYGTRKKSHNTSAIAQIGGKEIAAIQAIRVDDALAGKLAGVFIQNQDGAPGADPGIQIRAASISASNPLIVVDGYPISGGLVTVNPNDIQSLEVLKDAAAAAIYGSRGVNGVILVTTKKGESGKLSLNYNAYASTSSRYVKDNINPTAGEWGNTVETNVANGTFDISELDPEIYDYRLNALKNSPDVVAVEDWLFQTGNSMHHDLSMSGGTKDIDYFASVGYLNTKGVVQTQGFKRYNARLNFNANLGGKFKTGLNINGYLGDRDIVGHDQMDLLRAYSIHPIYHTEESIAFVQDLDRQAQDLGLDPFDDDFRGGNDAPWNSSIYTLKPGMTAQDWHYGRSGNGIGGSGDAGPATKLDNTDRFQKMLFSNFSSYFQFSIIDGLNLKTVLGADTRDVQSYFWRGLEFDSRARPVQSALQETELKRVSLLNETTLNYKKILGKHDIDAIAGVEIQSFYINGFATSGTNLPYGQPPSFSLLELTDIAASERKETTTRQSIFGRINYAHDNRYLASILLRRDGDSRLGENNKSLISSAFSLGWNVHNEAFYKSDFLSKIKLRYSHGSIETSAFLGSYSSLSLLNPTSTVFGTEFLIPSNIANPNLTFQTNIETNYGVNLGFLQNRFTIGVDYYTSIIENILINQSISEVLGTPSVVLNLGAIKSSGMEFELGANIIRTGDFLWNISANLSTVNTEITDLGGLDELTPTIYGQSGRGPVFRNYVGGGIGEMWGVETTGEVEMEHLSSPLEYPGQQSGYSYIVDQQAPGEEGHGQIDATRTVAEGGDLVKIGQNTPDFYWGLSSLAIKILTYHFSFKELKVLKFTTLTHFTMVLNGGVHYKLTLMQMMTVLLTIMDCLMIEIETKQMQWYKMHLISH